MTGEEGAKVVSHISVNINSSGDVSGHHQHQQLRHFGDSTLSAGLGLHNITRVDITPSSSTNNEQSSASASDIQSLGDSPLISDLSRPPVNNNNNLKEKNSAISVNEVESGGGAGELEAVSANNIDSPSERSNTPYSHNSLATPHKRNGRIDSSNNSGTGQHHHYHNNVKEESSPAEYPVFSEEELAFFSKEQLVKKYHNLQQHIQTLRGDNAQLKDSEEKLRIQQLEASRRENVLVMRLTTKEQELNECVAQLNELKSAVAPTPASLRSTLIDPAVNLIIRRMKKELEETKKKLEDTQNDLNAWKFTPDSNTGKRLMAKCRMLYQENEDLGKMITSGRLAKLESDLALEKSLTEEMKKSQLEMDELVQELDEDVEGMQSTIYFLQQQAKAQPNSNNNTSNALTNSTNSNSDLISISASELCVQCRALQDDKNNHLRGDGDNSSPAGILHQNSLKMEVDGDDNNESSLSKNTDNSDVNERTYMNGETYVSPSEYSERSQKKSPRTTTSATVTASNDRTKRATRSSKHSLSLGTSSSLSSSTDHKNLKDEDDSGDINVRKNECVESTINDSSEPTQKRVRTKKSKVVETTPPVDEGSDDASGGSSYTSPPPTKRTKKLANHSGSSALKRLNPPPVQVQNSNDSPITNSSNLNSGGSSLSPGSNSVENLNRNGSMDH